MLKWEWVSATTDFTRLDMRFKSQTWVCKQAVHICIYISCYISVVESYGIPGIKAPRFR